MDDDAGCASSFEDASMLNDSDCEVVHAPGEEEMLGARADEASVLQLDKLTL